jgi:NADH dehydrogenase
MKNPHHIVIVGAGAGGLELSTRLGNRFGKKSKINITLVNSSLTTFWKPLLHEVAAGTLNSQDDEINLFAHANAHYFNFEWGRMYNLNRQKKTISLEPVLDEDHTEILPSRDIPYDILIMAVGSEANDFNISSVREHCFFLDDFQQAKFFHQQFLKHFFKFRENIFNPLNTQLNIAIIGGGATGVELAAELHYASNLIKKYGIIQIKKEDIVQISIIEAGPSILSSLPPAIIHTTMAELNKRNIQVYTSENVTHIDQEGIYTRQKRFIPAELKIWAAGIKAPEFLKNLDGLKVNHLNQLIVTPTLQTTEDNHIFAIGDCSSCKVSKMNKSVPPRAQAAHQEAYFLVHSLEKYFNNKPLPQFSYQDYGSLISLGQYQTVGSIQKTNLRIFIKGHLARFAYYFLYRQYQATLHGWWWVIISIIANWLSMNVRPRVKLH